MLTSAGAGVAPGGAAVPVRRRPANPFPPGTIVVAAGLVVSGLSAYGFLVVAARALGKDAYAPLLTLWTLVFVAAPGCFLPLEQEVGRALAARRAHGVGGLPVLRRAGVMGLAIAACLALAALAAEQPLRSTFFAGSMSLVIALCVSIAVYAAYYLGKGTLGGTARFGGYSTLVATESASRLAIAVLLWVIGWRTVGAFGACMWVGPLAALLVVSARWRPDLEPGPQAAWSELTGSLGLLLVGSLAAQLLVNASVLAVRALDTAHPATTSAYGTGVVMTRIPLFFFQAVQAALLPRLSALLARGEREQFRALLLRLLAALVLVVVASVGGAYLLGGPVIRVLFGQGFALGGGDLAWLAGASGVYMLGLALSQALIAAHAQRLVAIGWVLGIAGFAAALAPAGPVVPRAEHAFAAGAAVAVVFMSLSVARLTRRVAGAGVATGQRSEATSTGSSPSSAAKPSS